MTDILFLTATVIALIWSGLRLRQSKRNTDSNSEIKSAINPYGKLGTFARDLRVISIESNPWMVLIAMVMFFFAISFLMAEFFAGSIQIIFISTVILSILTFFIIKEVAAKRRRNFEASLVEAIEIIQASSAAGASPQGAIQAVAESTAGLIQSEFGRLANALALGAPIESASARMACLYESEGVRMFIQILIAKWHVGGNLDQLMHTVVRMMRERVRMRVQIAGKISGAKFAAIFMGLAPYLLIPFFLLTQPNWILIMTTHPQGPTVLGIAFCLQIFGALWLRKVLRVSL